MNQSWITNRPGTPEIPIQINTIPNGEYTLFDDDVHTGQTTRTICSLLPERIKITGIQTLLDKDPDRIDILDARDFRFNQEYGGLVVCAREKIWRIPYLYPFVNFKRRTNMDNGRLISKHIFEVNKENFKNMTAESIADGFFVSVAGFNANTPATDIFDFYIKCLS